MRNVMLFCSLLFCLTWPVQALPEINAMAPLIVRERSEFQHQLKVAKKLGITAISVDVWWGRVEQWLLRDEADIACFLSPAWVEQPELLAWSPSLFTTRQVIVRRSHSPSITQLTDLLGKRVGTDRGFSYPEFDAVFSQRLIIRDDAISLQSNLMRLQKQRLDAVLTVDRAYEYHQQQFNSEGLLADPLWTAPDNVYCAINPNRPELASRVQQTLQLMIDDGTIQRILLRYQPAVRKE